MNKRLLIGAIVVLLVGGGAAAYFVTKDDDTSTPATSQIGNNQPTANPAFNAASTEGLEFKATISTAIGGQATESTIEQDDKGNTRYVASAGGRQMEIIYTSDAYYSCQGNNCVKFPVSQSSNSGFNPSDYTYDQSKLAGYVSGAAYKGQKSCPSGTCDVWSINTGGSTSTFYIDSTTKRITQVESTIAGSSTKIVYDYANVTITVPANAQTVPTQ